MQCRERTTPCQVIVGALTTRNTADLGHLRYLCYTVERSNVFSVREPVSTDSQAREVEAE